MAKTPAFQPVRKLEGLEKMPEAERALLAQLNAVRLDMGRALGKPVITELKRGNYLAREEEFVRYGPTGDATLQLPRATRDNAGARITVLLESVSLGTLTIQALGGTINALTTVSLLSIGRVDFISNGETGWFTAQMLSGGVPLTALASQVADTFVGRLAGAGSPTAQLLSDIDSTSIIYDGTTHTFQRAALTGEATASQNANAVTVTRSTDFQSSPWTGSHQFNADIRLGTLQTLSNQSGSINITRTAGAMRILVTSTADVTLGTISGCADGIPLIFEHVEASGAPNTLTVTNDTASANAFACPGEVNLAIVGRGGFVAVGRQGTNANWKIVATTN